jgi:Family of unknown function (DUF6190)
MTAREFVDATCFLGMNSADEQERLSCMRFFAARLDGSLGISAEQVGICDDTVWGYSRQEQDEYYPFMDNLHTVLRFERLTYTEADLATALSSDYPELPVIDRLTLAMVSNRDATLVTLNPRLLALAGAAVRHPAAGAGAGAGAEQDAEQDAAFPAELERLYQQSLALRVPAAAVLTR